MGLFIASETAGTEGGLAATALGRFRHNPKSFLKLILLDLRLLVCRSLLRLFIVPCPSTAWQSKVARLFISCANHACQPYLNKMKLI